VVSNNWHKLILNTTYEWCLSCSFALWPIKRPKMVLNKVQKNHQKCDFHKMTPFRFRVTVIKQPDIPYSKQRYVKKSADLTQHKAKD